MKFVITLLVFTLFLLFTLCETPCDESRTEVILDLDITDSEKNPLLLHPELIEQILARYKSRKCNSGAFKISMIDHLGNGAGATLEYAAEDESFNKFYESAALQSFKKATEDTLRSFANRAYVELAESRVFEVVCKDANHLAALPRSTEKVLILTGDLLEHTKENNFYTEPVLNEATYLRLSKACGCALSENLEGLDVYIISNRRGETVDLIIKTQQFYKGLFEARKARVHIDQSISLPPPYITQKQ